MLMMAMNRKGLRQPLSHLVMKAGVLSPLRDLGFDGSLANKVMVMGSITDEGLEGLEDGGLMMGCPGSKSRSWSRSWYCQWVE